MKPNVLTGTKSLLKRTEFELRQYWKTHPLDRRRKINFLHISKNAGSQLRRIQDWLNDRQDKYCFVARDHRVKLANLPEGQEYYFSIRHPVARFKSGFYSRKRRLDRKTTGAWYDLEKVAYGDFEHANELAEALFDDGKAGEKAFNAIRSIFHTATNQVDWFSRCGNIFVHRPPLFVVRQEHFEKDLKSLLEKLEIDLDIEISRDSKKAHIFDYSGIPPLSEKAVDNLKIWYSQDLAFYRLCEAWIESRSP